MVYLWDGGGYLLLCAECLQRELKFSGYCVGNLYPLYYSLRKALLLLKNILFGVNSVRNQVVTGTRARLSTQENGPEGVSVVHAIYVCKIRVAGVKGYYGLLCYPRFLECSVVQCSADICWTVKCFEESLTTGSLDYISA